MEVTVQNAIKSIAMQKNCNRMNIPLPEILMRKTPWHVLSSSAWEIVWCTIASKINVTPMVLLAHNNISQICYCGQISLHSAAVNCSFADNLTPIGVAFILPQFGTAIFRASKISSANNFTCANLKKRLDNLLRVMMMVMNDLYCVIVLVVLVMISSVLVGLQT